MAKTYSENLRHGSWQERRLEIMKRDGFCCVYCGSKEKLQVHHRLYLKGRKVHQYPDKDLQTLCDPCHFRIHFNKPIAPQENCEGVQQSEPRPESRISRLQKKLLEPIGEDLQYDILRHIMFLQKGGARG